MPHITIYGCDMEKNIRIIHADINIQFSREYYHSQHMPGKLAELENKLTALFEEYFAGVEVDVLSNHDYNIKRNER